MIGRSLHRDHDMAIHLGTSSRPPVRILPAEIHMDVRSFDLTFERAFE